jgi:nitrile hydratase subunit beta
MNGAHDCGGMMGYGPVLAPADEPVFHALWEARMFALVSAAGDIGGWTLDEDRAAGESMHPGHYITSGYYEHWLHGLEILLVRHGLATPGEIASGRAEGQGKLVKPTPPEGVWPAVTAPGSYLRRPDQPAAFRPGDRVRARLINPAHHTRLPRYLRGHTGEIVHWHGAHVFPDSNAEGRGEDPRHLYTVRFAAADLCGRATQDRVHADLWEPYLEAL